MSSTTWTASPHAERTRTGRSQNGQRGEGGYGVGAARQFGRVGQANSWRQGDRPPSRHFVLSPNASVVLPEAVKRPIPTHRPPPVRVVAQTCCATCRLALH